MFCQILTVTNFLDLTINSRCGRGGVAKVSAFGVWATVLWGPLRFPLYRVWRRPLLGGFKCIMGSSIGGSGTVRSRDGVHATEGPLIEVLLYTRSAAAHKIYQALNNCA